MPRPTGPSRLVVLLVGAGSLLVATFVVGDSSFRFGLTVVDNNRVGIEPTVSIFPNGTFLVSGMDSAGGQGHLWRGPVGWVHENPPTAGGNDSVVFAGPDGRTYFGELTTAFLLELASKLGNDWSSVSQFTNQDRPWLAEHGGTAYLVSTSVNNNPNKLQLRKTTDGASWSIVNDSIASAPDNQVIKGTNFTINDQGDIFLPYVKINLQDPSLYLAVSTDGGSTWTHSQVPGSPVNSPRGHHASSKDASGNVYVAWGQENTGEPTEWRIRYSVRLANGTWRGPWNVSSDANATTWGSAIIGKSTGKIDLAWYSQENPVWKLRFRQVTSADSETPVLSEEVAITNTAPVGDGEHPLFGDFLTMTAKSDGNAVIAFSCRAGDHVSLCSNDGKSHPVLSIQLDGPTL